MKIKSLMLGSMAALMAMGSMAYAADAIMVEPEPVEYVKVCDVYGNGYFYIPGTKRCLKISGDIRFDHQAVINGYNFSGNKGHTSGWRGRMNVYAREQVEIGEVSSRIRFTHSGDGLNDAFTSIDTANIYLSTEALVYGVGYGDSFWTLNHSYGFNKAMYDGYYSADAAMFGQVQWFSDGITLTVGGQDTDATDPGSFDVYGGLSYDMANLRVAATVIQDSSTDDIAWKVSGSAIVGETGLKVGGWYMASDDVKNAYVTGTEAYGVWGSFTTGKLDLYGGYTDSNATLAYATIGARYNVSSNLYITPEYVFTTEGSDDNSLYKVRIVRSF